MDTNRTGGARATSKGAELIREIERRRLRALVDADTETAAPLHADGFKLINPFGEALSKERYMDLIASRSLRYLEWEPESDIAVHLYDGAAVIRYLSRMVVIAGSTHISTRAWHTDLYERREGRWQVVWSQATRVVN